MNDSTPPGSSILNRRDLLRSLAVASVGLGLSRVESAAQPASRELLIRGGTVVNDDGRRRADVRIRGETIVEVGTDLAPAGAETQVIEAGGLLIMPGGVDPHTHLQAPFADDLTDGSKAALAGGITSLGTFAYARSGESATSGIDRVAERIRASAIADIFLHAQSWPPSSDLMTEIAARGCPSFKVFGPTRDFEADADKIVHLLEAARDAGVVTLFHCEDRRLLDDAARKLEAAGRATLADYGESRPVMAEISATERVAAWCKSTGATVYIVHLSSARALQACRSAESVAGRLFVETRPLYLYFSEERLRGPEGPLYVGMPPLRTPTDSNALWRGLTDGSIDVLASDHAPWLRTQKLDPNLTIRRPNAGVSDLQFMLPMYFSEGTRNRGLSLERFVATSATNASRIFGLYPRKGVIRAGSDADVVIWDPKRVAKVAAEGGFSKADYSVYEGTEVTGWPRMTIRRGEVVYDQGRILALPGSGKLLVRAPSRPNNG